MTTPINHYDGHNATFHPVKSTLGRNEASRRTIELWGELRDITRNEEAWYIIEKALAEERLEGHAEGRNVDIEVNGPDSQADGAGV